MVSDKFYPTTSAGRDGSLWRELFVVGRAECRCTFQIADLQSPV